MPTHDTDTRVASLVDIPLVRRLIDQGVALDSELAFTRDLHSALVSSILLPQRGLCTLVTRSDKQQVVGQFRLRPDDSTAHIVYLSPGLAPEADDTTWLHALDAMAREAGRYGAHALLAEVDEDGPLFETLRAAGYAVYARQEIWARPAGGVVAHWQTAADAIALREETEADALGVQSLLTTTVPGLVQQYAAPSPDMAGLVYRRDDHVDGYFAYSEGRHGVFVIPYLHPDVLSDAPAIIQAALEAMPRAGRLDTFVCVRRYQDWIIEALAELHFGPVAQQAVMVKHITAGVRHATFTSLASQLERASSVIKPPAARAEAEPPIPAVLQADDRDTIWGSV